MTLNVEKMRRHMARTTPDAVWKSYDVLKLDDREMLAEHQAFVSHFGKMMKIKHGKKLRTIMAFQSEITDPTQVRIQLVAKVDS